MATKKKAEPKLKKVSVLKETVDKLSGLVKKNIKVLKVEHSKGPYEVEYIDSKVGQEVDALLIDLQKARALGERQKSQS